MRGVLFMIVLAAGCGKKKEAPPKPPPVSDAATADAMAPDAPAPPAPDASAPDVPPGEAPSPEAIRALHAEPIAGVTLGMSAEEVRKILGTPQERSAPTPLENTKKEFGMTWTWPTMTAELASATKDGKFTLRSITFHERSQVKTKRGVGIGSTRAEIAAAYPGLAEPIFVADKRMYVVGAVPTGYGLNGIRFTFRETYEEAQGDLEKDRVRSIEWAGGAEQ